MKMLTALLTTWRIILERIDVVLCLVEFSAGLAGACKKTMKVAVSFRQGGKIGSRRLYSTKRGVNNLKIFLSEGTVFSLHVREDFLHRDEHHAVYGITHLRAIVVRGGINEIGSQGFDTTLDFAALVARYLIVFHSRGWGTWGRLSNSS